jgi:hypothetical protein
MQADKENDRNHKDYVVPPLDDKRQIEYANFIARKCLIHEMWIDSSDNYNDWRSALRMSVAMEKYIKYLENVCK